MDRVVVVDGDPRWPQQFHEIAANLAPFVEPLVVRIEHVRSTAVPAWPPSRSSTSTWWSPARNYYAPSSAASSRPATGGWAISTWPVVKPLRLLRHRPSLPEHHLYLVVENNRAHCDHWLFRNSLNAYPELRDRYSAIKRENAVLARGDIDRYVALKAAFVAQVLTVARRERAMAPVTYWEPDLG